MRQINYARAIDEALVQKMDHDPSVLIYGLGVPDHKYIFGTVESAVKRYPHRCLDMPLSEDAMVGFGIGAAVNGMRPVNTHIRVDFMLLAMNQLVNMASSYRYTGGGSVPLVIRAIVGRGWGQGCHHSKSLHSYFAHVPGLRVIAPTTPHQVKGLMIEAIETNDPVVILEHRWLYWGEGEVEEKPYKLPIGFAEVLREGTDLTVIGVSWMTVEALKAAEVLERHHGVSLEVVDVVSLSPLDIFTLAKSVIKTKRCIVADNDWWFCGYGSEIAATLQDTCFGILKAPIKRIGWAMSPCPTARHLENAFYCNAIDIIREAERLLDLPLTDLSEEDFYSHERKFKGPF